MYDAFYQEQLEYVYDKCGGSGPTELPPPITIPAPEPEPFCASETFYVTQIGDTCESIANATGVSAASLYMGNQALLPDCSDLEPGLSVCVPLGCKTYYLRPSDTCISVETALGLDFGLLQQYNTWIDSACSNLQAATDFYGKIICVTPPGGAWTPDPESPNDGSPPEAVDGYTKTPVSPPDGVPVADGTTLNCGRWHVVESGDMCVNICLEYSITASLFRTVNPSLSPDDCTPSLRPGVALCVGPTYSWNSTDTEPTGTETETVPAPTLTVSSTTGGEPTTPPGNGVETPTPIQPGMVDDCDTFYFVQPGQGCADIAASNKISLNDFYSWNPNVGDTCGALWSDVYVCVGVLGSDPTPTDPGTGVSTPTPVLPGMVDGCDKFHLVGEGDGCWDMANTAGISLDDFYAWNPQAAPDCAGLWLGYYVCLSLA